MENKKFCFVGGSGGGGGGLFPILGTNGLITNGKLSLKKSRARLLNCHK